jgi:hypothetical protein
MKRNATCAPGALQRSNIFRRGRPEKRSALLDNGLKRPDPTGRA